LTLLEAGQVGTSSATLALHIGMWDYPAAKNLRQDRADVQATGALHYNDHGTTSE